MVPLPNPLFTPPEPNKMYENTHNTRKTQSIILLCDLICQSQNLIWRRTAKRSYELYLVKK